MYVRRWERVDGWYVTSSVSTDYPAMPPNPKFVRGEQNPTVVRVKDAGPNRLIINWLLNVDVKVCASDRI